MRLKLLDVIQLLSVDNLAILDKIQLSLEMRMDWLNDREPESYGLVHDEWDEKVDDLQEIMDYVDELKEETDIEKQKELIDDIKNSADTYQVMHGGLKRWYL
jgi:hypothetical protein